MQNVVLLVACLLAGMALKHFRKVPLDGHLSLNAVIINVALPGLILAQVHGIHLDPDLILAVSMPWLLFLSGGALFWVVARYCDLSPSTTGALMLTGGLGNTSFMGLPMIEAFYGKSGMPVGILIDQLGTYMVLSTLGIAVACICSRGEASPRSVAIRIVTFPPLIALVVAVALIDVSYPTWLQDAFSRLGATVAPLALVSVGMQLKLDAWRGNRGPLAMGLAYKLLAGPAILAFVYVGVIGIRSFDMRVTLFEAAMGPQIGGAVVATQYGLNPPLVTLMVGIGTLLAFATLPLWSYVLGTI